MKQVVRCFSAAGSASVSRSDETTHLVSAVVRLLHGFKMSENEALLTESGLQNVCITVQHAMPS
jgi:hypothetical protein